MAATVPMSVGANAAGTALQDYVTALYNQLVAAPGDFTISNVVGGGTPTSWTLTHADGWQINYRVSGGTLLSLIAPDGGISDSASPGTPTNASPEDVVLPAVTGTTTRYQFCMYDDAILFAINATGNTHSAYSFHHGRILNRNNAVDPLNGLGVLAYLPNDAGGSTLFEWATISSTAGSRKSWIRIGTSTWANCTWASAPSGVGVLTAERIGNSVGCKAPDSGAPSTATSLTRGVFRYLGEDSSSPAGNPLSVVPAVGSNQGWLRLKSSSATTRLVALWDKLVTP